MANLIAPQPMHLANSEAPVSVKSANALPADIKTAGKSGKEIQKDAKSASEAFAANLKEQAENQAKKDALKKGVPQAPGQNLQTPAPQVVVAKEAAGKDAAGKAGLAEKGGIAAVITAKGANATPVGKGLPNKALDALLTEQANANADPALAKTTPATAKDNLTPLQQMMLNESMTNKRMAANNLQVGPSGAVANAELSQALESLGAPNAEIDHDFELESLALSGAAGKEILNGKEAETAKRAPASKVSTSDFLDLRNLSLKNLNPQNASQGGLDLGTALKAKDGKKDKLEALTGKEAFAGTLATRFENGPHIKTIDAPVTQGTAGKNVLSHDAIHQMTQSVNLLSQARQDGEIKIRLRPDHLGELHMSVKTQGQQVSIEIKAQNSESKKIIEASLASLKDSLGQQNLTLARVDIVNAPAHAQNAADQGLQMDMSQFRQNSGQGSDRGFDQGGSSQDLRYEEMSAPINLNTVRMSGVNARAGQGLDLIA